MCLLQPRVLWLFVAVRLTTAEACTSKGMVNVCTRNSIKVSCLKNVTLHCNITSQEGREIKYLSWLHEHNEILCDVNWSTGKTEIKHTNPRRHVECTYTRSSQLTLTLLHVQPLDRGNYTCKLRSISGIKNSTTHVKFQECYTDATASFNNEGPICVFKGVYPDGEVHWFHGTNNLTGDAKITKQMEDGGALTVTSSLEKINVEGAYNCSLWIPSTGVYLASRVLEPMCQNSDDCNKNDRLVGCAVAVFGPVWKLWFILLSFHSVVSSV